MLNLWRSLSHDDRNRIINKLLMLSFITMLMIFDSSGSLYIFFICLFLIVLLLHEEFIRYIIARERRTKFKNTGATSYEEKFKALVDNLRISSLEVDKSLVEITEFTKEKTALLEKLESEMKALSDKEINLKNKIETLEKVPVEALKHFHDILNSENSRSAKRDYLLFLLGVAFSVISALILKKFGV